jgi:ER lumen protein retaining receptor
MDVKITNNILVWEMTWSYSQWLESLAIFPQIAILSQDNGVEPFTAHYIACLGSYRFFYIINWYECC